MNKLYVVGIGPGDPEGMTLRAARALADAEVIVGYGVYVDLVKPLYPDKEYLVTPMRHEAERCRAAIACALSGRVTAVISSGDAGVYGMAGLVYELSDGLELDIEIVPGVTAALSGAAALGAPLGHDFAVISLSDLLTPWEKIEARLELAARADLCVALYNPASHRRVDALRRACGILLRHQSPEIPCGLARNIGRAGEQARVVTLGELAETPVDMFTTVFIGNSQTKVIGGRLVTPRGYRDV